MVGLGNPGVEFAGTRHNVGAEVAARLCERHGGRLRSEKGLHSSACEVRIGQSRVLVAIPSTFMNDSGLAAVALVRRAGIDHRDPGGSAGTADRLVVVHDELDLPSGRVKVKAGGGSAGHNGLKSIDRHLHTNEYLRVRVGIGKPPDRQSGADYVLRRPGGAERTRLLEAIEVAADAVESIVNDGAEAAMTRTNAG